jgi:hypothetical protein
MSDNWLQFVPADPAYQPSRQAAEDARILLTAFVPGAQSVLASFKKSVEFFHPGGNWSGVECPACGADAESWWEDAMEVASRDDFSNLLVTASCCGTEVSLNELRYVWPAAFGCFALEAMNPDVRDLSPDEELQLQKSLGCGLRKVWVHL